VSGRVVELFYDVASAYSYLASTQIERVVTKHGASVHWRPFLLGAVFKATDNKPPASVAAKGPWMLKDLARWAEMYGIGFNFPSSFPPNSVRAMRACVAADAHGKVRDFSTALFDGYWIEDRDPSSDAAIDAAATRAGIDGPALRAATETQPVKDALRANTDEAIARGAFGAPTMFLGDVMLWGNDRLPMLEHLLAR
jgi:2-hydroxychromene-2-carboxylate isomerase